MFKDSFKSVIEAGFKTMLKYEHSFYTITVPGKIDEFIKQNFFYLNGRIRLHHKYTGKLLLALEGESIDIKTPHEEFTIGEFLESRGATIEDFEI